MKGDTADRNIVEKLMAEVDMAVHFAAESHVGRSIAHPEQFLHSNIVGTFTLLEVARRALKADSTRSARGIILEIVRVFQ